MKNISGSGTEQDPYRISTAEELKLFRDIVNGENGRTQNTAAWAVLENDIVLNDGTFDADGNYTAGSSGAAPTEWTPIGNRTNKYIGTFNGNGKTIRGLYINGIDGTKDRYVGLFGCLDQNAFIENLTVTGYIKGLYICGGIAAYIKNATVKNCRNLCTITGVSESDYSFLYVGGIAGYISNSSAILECSNEGALQAIGGLNSAGGIVAYLAGHNVTIKDCYNKGSVEANTTGDNSCTAGGIAAKANSPSSTISSCYNSGAITISYYGNRQYISTASGIVGNLSSKVFDCFNVGAITAQGNSTIASGISGGIFGGISGGVAGRIDSTINIGDVYCLAGAAENGIDINVDSMDKSPYQFADGTVLNSLICGRDDADHPWAKECRYFAAAKMTLPVFKNQIADAHIHESDQWESDGEKHWKMCSCNAMFEESPHTGGMATCKAKAECELCGRIYGELDPKNHATNGKQEWTKTATTHEKKWSCCGAVIVSSEPHAWADGACSECGYSCAHADANSDHVCDTCGKVFPNHTGGKTTGKDKSKCEICGEEYSELDPTSRAADGKQSPQTGDNSNLMLWMALLLGGGAVIGATVVARKKKYNR